MLIPLRHVAYASNINNAHVGAYAYGIAMSQAATYASMDQLGVAQYLTRLAIAFGDLDGLAAGKAAWLNAPHWQDLRCCVEDMMVMKDWFELFVAQNLALDGLMYPLFFERLNDRMSLSYGATIAMLTRFPREWHADNSRWVDAVIKVAAAESPENNELLVRWTRGWRDRAAASLNPVVFMAFGDDAECVMDEVLQQFDARAAKLGLAL